MLRTGIIQGQLTEEQRLRLQQGDSLNVVHFYRSATGAVKTQIGTCYKMDSSINTPKILTGEDGNNIEASIARAEAATKLIVQQNDRLQQAIQILTIDITSISTKTTRDESKHDDAILETLSKLTMNDIGQQKISDEALLRMLPKPEDGVQYTFDEVIGFNKHLHKSIRGKVKSLCKIPRKPKKAICMACRQKGESL
jgi:hypothetical protein